jgi:hypothetical protein
MFLLHENAGLRFAMVFAAGIKLIQAGSWLLTPGALPDKDVNPA